MVAIYKHAELGLLVWAMRKSCEVCEWQMCIRVFSRFNLVQSIFTPILHQDVSFTFSTHATTVIIFTAHSLSFWPPFCPLVSAGLDVFCCSSSIQLHKRPWTHLRHHHLHHHPFSLPLPPTHRPLASFSFSLLAPGWSVAWGVQRGESWRGRIRANWKEGGNMKGRSWRAKGRAQAGEGWAGERKTPESEAMIWLLALSSGEREGGVQRHGESKNGMEWKRESLLTWPQGALSSLSLFHPLFVTFYTNCPHTKR